jgi:hypothetical protein
MEQSNGVNLIILNPSFIATSSIASPLYPINSCESWMKMSATDTSINFEGRKYGDLGSHQKMRNSKPEIRDPNLS